MAESLFDKALRKLGPHALKAQLASVRLSEYMADPPEGMDDLTALDALDFLWEDLLARPEQLPPAGDWDTWVVRPGRGWGKTRTGAQTTIAMAQEAARQIQAGRLAEYDAILHLVGATAADVRDVMVGGPAGILRCSPPWFPAHYEPSNRRILWPNGVQALLFSAEEPARLRGPQGIGGWADELAHWKYVEETWDNFQFGIRLGRNPRIVVTSTPRPIKKLKEILAEKGTVQTRGKTADNVQNLNKKAIDKLYTQYGGTRLGRQELEGEILDDNPNALWKLKDIEALRFRVPPTLDRPPGTSEAKWAVMILEARGVILDRVVIGCDPAMSNNPKSNETGIIAAGAGMCRCKGKPERHAFVLADGSGEHTPAAWGLMLVRMFGWHGAQRIIAEINQGGALVEANLRGTPGGQNLPYKGIHAKKGKYLRAEPVSALTEQGKVHHVGSFPELEDQQTQWNPQDPTTGGESPDRLDAYVYAVTELMIQGGTASFEGVPSSGDGQGWRRRR